MATSYSNTGGSGNRTAIITVTATSGVLNGAGSTLVNGNLSETVNFFTQQNNGGKYIRFSFPSSKIIDEIKFYQELTTSHNSFQIQGSNDAAAWTDIGSPFVLGGVATQTITAPSGNTTGFLHYQLIGTGDGNMQDSPWIYEFEFKIDDAGGAATAVPVFMNQYRQRRA